MKLTEYKNKKRHYFVDEQGRMQSEYKSWHDNGHQQEISHYLGGKLHGERKLWYAIGQPWQTSYFRDGKIYGEYKGWDSSGNLIEHTFDIDEEEIINFLENAELYPSTPEEKTMFALKYGNAPFISEGEVE